MTSTAEAPVLQLDWRGSAVTSRVLQLLAHQDQLATSQYRQLRPLYCSGGTARYRISYYELDPTGQSPARLSLDDNRAFRLVATYWVRYELEEPGRLVEVRRDFPRSRPAQQDRPW